MNHSQSINVIVWFWMLMIWEIVSNISSRDVLGESVPSILSWNCSYNMCDVSEK